jgi:hypothetical protein
LTRQELSGLGAQVRHGGNQFALLCHIKSS